MINKWTFIAPLLLAAGCARPGYEPRVTMLNAGSPDSGSYSAIAEPATAASETATSADFDNTSQVPGARTLTGDPDQAAIGTAEPVGAAVATGEAESQTGKGAGARALTGTTESADIVQDDATFVREAGQAGIAEVKLGQLAQQQAEAQAMKDFGQQIANDHQKANDELAQIAIQKGFQIPTAMAAKDSEMIQHLSILSAVEFDKACGYHAVEAHQKAIRLFKAEAQSGQDLDLKAFALKTLPTLEEHLRMAKQLKGSPSSE